MNEMSPEVREALDTFANLHFDAVDDNATKAQRYAARMAIPAAEQAVVAAIQASHPLVALWREWVEAKAVKLEGWMHWSDVQPIVQRQYAAERALLNYRSDT